MWKLDYIIRIRKEYRYWFYIHALDMSFKISLLWLHILQSRE